MGFVLNLRISGLELKVEKKKTEVAELEKAADLYGDSYYTDRLIKGKGELAFMLLKLNMLIDKRMKMELIRPTSNTPHK